MLSVKDIMTSPVITVHLETEITKVAKLFMEKNINGIPVVDDDENLIGIICQSDLVAQQKRIPIPTVFTILDGFLPFKSMKQLEREVSKIAATTAEHAMTPDPVTVTPDMGIDEAATLMVDKHFHTLPVVAEGKIIGILGQRDLLKTLLQDT